MRVIQSEIEIRARAERVWQIITDLSSFSRWNPFIQRASGVIAQGEKLDLFMHPPGNRGMTFKPTVMQVVPGRQLLWLGHLGIPGLFDGRHSLILEPLASDRTRFVQREEFTGLLVPVFSLALEKNTRRGFELMNQALKARAEQFA